MEDAYSILNLYSDCTLDEAREAYRDAALKHHPDRHPDYRKAEAERRFKLYANAYLQICKDLNHEVETYELAPPKVITGLNDTAGALAIRKAAAEARAAPLAAAAAIPAIARPTLPVPQASPKQQQVARRLPAKARTPEPEPEPEEEYDEEEEEEDEEEYEEEEEEDEDEDEDEEYEEPASTPPRQQQRHPRPQYQRRSANEQPVARRMPPRDQYNNRQVERYEEPRGAYSREGWLSAFDNEPFGGRSPAGGLFGASDPFGGSGSAMFGGGPDMFDQIRGTMDKLNRMDISNPAFGRGGGGHVQMRSTRTTLVQGEDGEWVGQTHNKAMRAGNGKLDMTEDGREVHMPGAGGAGRRRPQGEERERVGAGRDNYQRVKAPRDAEYYDEAPPAYSGPSHNYTKQAKQKQAYYPENAAAEGEEYYDEGEEEDVEDVGYYQDEPAPAPVARRQAPNRGGRPVQASARAAIESPPARRPTQQAGYGPRPAIAVAGGHPKQIQAPPAAPGPAYKTLPVAAGGGEQVVRRPSIQQGGMQVRAGAVRGGRGGAYATGPVVKRQGGGAVVRA